MKKIVVIMFAAVVLAGCVSQEKVPVADRVYQQIVDVSATKQDAYTKTLEWIAKSFGSSEAVIQFKDPEQGKIIGKGIVSVNYGIVPIDTFFTLTIELRDNRVRFTFENMYPEPHEVLLPDRMPLDTRLQLDKFSQKASQLIEDWKAYVAKNASNW
jgi:hypothetical protein